MMKRVIGIRGRNLLLFSWADLPSRFIVIVECRIVIIIQPEPVRLIAGCFIGVAYEWIVETHLTVPIAIDGKIGLQKNYIVVTVPAGILVARIDQIWSRWICRSALRDPLMNLVMKRASIIGRKLDIPGNCQIGVG